MAFTTSFFSVSSPKDGERGGGMDVDDDARNNAGARMRGDHPGEGAAQEAAEPPQPQQPANTSLNGTSHLTSRISPPPQKDGDIRFGPNKSDAPTRPNGNEESEALTMPKKSIKKKGTAAPVKAPRRGGKGGGGGSTRKGVTKGTSKPPKRPKTTDNPGGHHRSSSAAATGASSQNGASDDDDGGGEEEEEEESGSDQGIYCICRGPDNHRFMIACDRCEDWFHGDCIGMDKYTGENLVQRYICPNCTDGKLYATRYKKTCALDRCERPARMYGDDVVGRDEASIFCSEEHCQLWWEQLVGTLPRSRTGGLYGDVLTQEEFMGLLGTGKKGGRKEGWKIGDEPFGVPPNFWDTTPPSEVLTGEESALLAASVSDRHSLGEEIVLCKKMLQLIDLAVKQRETLISASSSGPKSQALGKDFCGYDYRLDDVGATAAFAAFVKSAAGEAIFKSGRLPLPGGEGYVAPPPPYVGGEDFHHVNGNAAGAGGMTAALAEVMCVRRKCKPHAGWSGIHTKNVKQQIKELAAQAKEKLDFEARIRDCAAVRYQRKKRENNRVEVVGPGRKVVMGE